uniref:3-hydroxyacyl-CoA dehydrogenase type-2 n=1 Tax=Neobodo designis TaxID=312471 RepID=A0A7S1Q6L2_NEODS|mmetsp:Transcript_33272/g.102753  ORF Transcript_33272/g.102753 Transcript_33272/m.102753 type:complete len:253 (+) Transcript_33272:50-808(+)|eukprot:CAMPEP_0174850358 /NCGR_PEP_ID=MMETSP1114-20130205/19184_1 /TAXON_ID=312471 /ORGANISM="Neobodo designis, Strain CCAP 1951/1" /LENGTH=252 /DNA_ID=CAMNT_0016084815 /DNA_START=42 /DNA_END=800 /DNA_ORIENTATION=+
MRSVANHSVLITGAASGLGAAAARMMAKNGAKVTLVDLDEANGPKVAEEIKGQFIKTDITNEEQVKAAIAAAQSNFGPLRGAVNCAGIAPPAKVVGKKGAHRLDLFAKVINVNLVGTFNVSRLAAEAMTANEAIDTERGVIVNTASIAAFDGQIGQAAYAASKGGVVALTLPMARELAAHGIRVCTVAPGIMGTPMLAGLPQAAQDSLGKSVPFPQRMGNPDEYASLVHHIFANGYLNGEVIRLDGALRMAP